MKNTFKKSFAFVLAAAMLLGLAACGKKEDTSNENAEIIENTDELQENLDALIEENVDFKSESDVGDYVAVGEEAFDWTEVDSGVAITGYIGEPTAIIIPDAINGKKVVEISTGAFSDTAIVGVKLPDSVKTIGEKAFYYCSTLVEVVIGTEVSTIEEKAFEGCMSLSSLKFNNNVLSIGMMAFNYCSSLKEVTLPASLTVLEPGAFSFTGIEEVTIPGNVETIGYQAFDSCEALKSVIVDDGVITIEDQVFDSCKALNSITLPDSVNSYGIRVFNHCDNVVIHAPAGSAAEEYAKEYDIPFVAE